MLVTRDTSHFERSLLNAAAPKNVAFMLVTPETAHFERSLLNADPKLLKNAVQIIQ